MSSTFADKVIRFIKILFAKVPEIITDFRIEKLSRLSKKTIAVIGAVTLTVIVICGAFVLSGGEEPENASLLTALQTEEQEEQAIHYYAINIETYPLPRFQPKKSAQAVIDSIVAHFSTKGSESSAAYKEKVGIVEGEAVDPVVMSVEDATNMIITGTKEPKVYTVESGDCLWDIAVKNGMSVEELISSNPDADVQHLKIGSTLNLYELKPYVHVSLTERATTTERIDYDIIYEETGTLYKGEIKVKTAGVYGKREVTKEIVKENGVAVSTTEISSSVISEPSTANLKGQNLCDPRRHRFFCSPMGYLEISSSYGSCGGGRHTALTCNPKEHLFTPLMTEWLSPRATAEAMAT